MKIQLLILSLILGCFLGCSPDHEVEPSGPIAGLGSTPTIDGVFEDGEWDDAEVVQVDKNRHFRIKHDGTHLYFAFDQDGGSLYFYKNTGLHVLHASAQLGMAKYIKVDNLMQSLDKAFEWQLWGLQNEPVIDVNEKVADYLAKNGWVASIGHLGNIAQAEWAVSFDWLGVTNTGQRYVEAPKLFMFLARMRLSPEEKEALSALPPEERKNRYPALIWPVLPVPDDSLNNGKCPETINIDPTGWGKIWIDRPCSGRKSAWLQGNLDISHHEPSCFITYSSARC
ncbi:MAG: hypothetical protein JXB26_18115 [Candidatus Aminicenantes bacterium]|nr:hypothetical protein [Candidatus Aminicenantes bacterium]